MLHANLRTLAAVIADAWADSSPSRRAIAVEILHRPETTPGGESLHLELIELSRTSSAMGTSATGSAESRYPQTLWRQ